MEKFILIATCTYVKMNKRIVSSFVKIGIKIGIN